MEYRDDTWSIKFEDKYGEEIHAFYAVCGGGCVTVNKSKTPTFCFHRIDEFFSWAKDYLEERNEEA